MRLRIKFSLAFSAAILIVVVAMTVVTSWVQRGKISKAIEEKEKRELQNWAAVCAQAYALNSDLLPINYLKVLSQSPGVRYAYWTDPGGTIMVHSDPRFILKNLSEWDHAKPPDAHELSQDATMSGKKVGGAYIGFSDAYRKKELKSGLYDVLRTSVSVGAAGIALGIGLAVLLALFFSRPIRELAQASEEVSRGNWKIELPVRSRDELGELTARFNQMAKRLGELDELKDEFIAMVSHDLRSPLAAIRGYADALKVGIFGPLNEKQAQAMATVNESAGRLALFINNILDSSKMKAGKLDFSIKPQDLSEIADRVVNLLAMSASMKKVSLTAEIPAGLPKVLADGERLDQILTNLISNAIKFTPQNGRITLSARENGRSVRIGVQDSGPGIAADNLNKLFQKYERIEESAQKEQRITGTGLGLVITRGMVEKQGGKIWVESELGKGTTFFFTLPKEGTKA